MRFLFAAFSLLCWASYTQAQSHTRQADTKAFENGLRQAGQNTQTLTGDFVQTKHIDVLSETIESAGKLYYKSQNLLRWEYTRPFVYLIVINNGKLTIKDEGSKNSFDLSNNKTFNKINELITKSLKGDAMLNHPDYKHELWEDNKEYLLKLFPQDKKTREFMQHIEIYFNKSDYQVRRVKMVETSGDYTDLVFKNRKINEPINERVFVVD